MDVGMFNSGSKPKKRLVKTNRKQTALNKDTAMTIL